MRNLPAAVPALADEVAIVTGASSGIGAATARELARRGAAVVLTARRTAMLDVALRQIREAGGSAIAVTADMSERADIAMLAERALTAFGRVDVLVNNAGANWTRSLASTSPAEITDLAQVNLLAPMLLTRAVLPGMLERRRGAIICVGSLSGRVAMEPLYSATKYGVRGFSLALRRQLAGTGVAVSLVSPGNINTAMTRHITARLPEPTLVAQAIADLIRHPRRELVIPRRHYAIAWLEQAFPQLADFAHRRRGWSPVREEEAATWTSLSPGETVSSAGTSSRLCRTAISPSGSSRCPPRTPDGSASVASRSIAVTYGGRTRSSRR